MPRIVPVARSVPVSHLRRSPRQRLAATALRAGRIAATAADACLFTVVRFLCRVPVLEAVGLSALLYVLIR